MRGTFLFGLSLAAGLASCGGDELVLPSEGKPAAISIVAGDNQSGRVGETLAQPVVIQVTDVGGRPVAGAMVELELDGVVDTVSTGADGRASAELALGSSVGQSTGHARVVLPESPRVLETTFTVTAVSASANGLAMESGDGQTAAAGSALPDPLVVSVTDAFGNPVEGVTVSWSAQGGGSVGQSSTTTGADGVTSVTRTLGPTAGTQTTTASAEGLAGSPVIFTHTAAAGSAAGVRVVSGDQQTGDPGQALPRPLVVGVTDADGNAVSGAAVTWVVTAGGGSVDPSTGSTGSDGQTGTTWTLGPGTGTNTVEAVVSGVGRAVFTATATPGAPSVLAIRTQPSDAATLDEPFSRQPVIQLRDALGNDVKQTGVSVTAAIASGPGNLVGTSSRNTDADGRASFTDLAISGTAGDHALIFAAPGFTSVVSASITVSPPANEAPIANDDSFEVDQDGVLTVDQPGVLGNDTDPESDPLTAALVGDPAHGTVTLSPDGSFEYTPEAGYSGSDGFTYQADDGTNTSAPATVTITVNAVVGVNHPPSFLPGPDQDVRVQDGPQTVVRWATEISPGPADEAAQLVSFIVRVDKSGKKLFDVEPTVSPEGTLTYTPKRHGTTTATVAARDNGGTANGGQDTSPDYTVVFTFE